MEADADASLRCPSCDHDVDPAARFCAHCGTRLTTNCDQCQGPIAPGARSCTVCGRPTAAAAPAAPGAADPAERRQVTVMFCDVVDSTGLSDRVDPEELRDLMRGYYEVCAREVARAGGYLAQYRGDGVLVYFGYPVAREQDAQAAVVAGLAIVRTMARGAKGPGATKLSVRVGIHTGLVVAGEVVAADKRELFVVGSTPNVAARVETAAEPDTVVISDATHRLVRGFFECVDLGEHSLRGVLAPMRLWRVSGETGVQSRVEALGAELTPLVGRDEELGTLVGCWRRVVDGRGLTVLVAGEPGLGKSRLLHELRVRLADEPHLVLECRCSPHTESTALFPIIDLLERAWQLRDTDSPAERIAHLERAVQEHVPDVADAFPLLAGLLSVPLPASRCSPLDLTPQARKKRTLDVLVAILSGLAQRQPLLFAVEDLHWVDPSTLELVSRLVEEVPARRILALLLFRPTFVPPWAAGDQVRRLNLARLRDDETDAMIERVAGGRTLPSQVMSDLRARVDGVPLYAEELTKMVLEAGCLRERDGRYELVSAMSGPAVPTSLHDSLMARIDRLAPTRGVLQLGATIGREFSHDLIQAVAGLDEAVLDAELSRLVEAQILHRVTAPKATYVFKHALIQDAAYESLLKNRRREYHIRIAEALERGFPDVVETRPELLGHHWANADRPLEAVGYLLRAGRLAYERSAYTEAASTLRRGLTLIEEIPDPGERRRAELEVLLALGPVLVGTLGYSNPEVEAVYARARALGDQLGSDARLRFTVLSGLLLFHQSRAELSICNELSRQRLALARELADPSLEMLVHENLGTVAYWLGAFAGALAALREACARYTPEGGRVIRLLYGTDTSVVCNSYQAHTLFFLGYPDQAREQAAKSLEVARELGHVHSLVLALSFAGTLHRLRGELDAAEMLLDEAEVLAQEQQLAQWMGSCAVTRADILVARGRPEEGIARFLDGLSAFQATGATIAGRFFAALLAQAYLAAGDPQQGIAVLDSLLAMLERSEDVFYDPEVLRTRGRLLLAVAPDDIAPAEACFVQALEMSRGFAARSLELRAATALAELWGRCGRADEAHRLLSDVYGWFTEGFDTPDLRTAAAVLSRLRTGHAHATASLPAIG